jgi:hypothetical protein
MSSWLANPLKIFFTLVFISAPVYLIIFYTGNIQFTCEKQATNSVTCQKEKKMLYGLITQPEQSFKLTGVKIEKKVLTDEEKNSYELYEIYLKSDQGLILMDSKKDDFSWAKEQKSTIETFIYGKEPLFIYQQSGESDTIVNSLVAVIFGMVALSIFRD